MELFEELGLVRSINDPIHGVIRVTTDEMKVIEHPLFRRLHHVRQNSFLYKVFPSAKHTRFEHSIGVLNYAHQILNSICENGYIANSRGDIVSDRNQFKSLLNPGVGINLIDVLRKSENNDSLKHVFLELRLAALLHDIGHGPLSHLFDAFAPSVEEFMTIIKNDSTLNTDEKFVSSMGSMLDAYHNKQKEKNSKDIRIEHEHVSSYFTYKILKSIGSISESQIYNVLTILKPELALGQRLINCNELDFDVLPLLNDIVASAPIDCDRMDYLKRDSFFAGVPYGDYSDTRVLKSMLAYANDENKIRLGLKISGLHAIENFLQARYEMYVQVYGHKTNEACKAMLNFVTQEEGLEYRKWSGKGLSASEFEDVYISLSDEHFVDCLLKVLSEDKKKALQNIKDRNLWKRIFEFEEFIDQKDKSTELSQKFNESYDEMIGEFGEKNLDKYIDERFPLKDMDKGAQLLEKSNHGFYAVSSQKIREASQIIKSLNDGLRITRVYSLDGEEAARLKSYAAENILPELTRLSVIQNSKF